jgi:hypothetical protein
MMAILKLWVEQSQLILLAQRRNAQETQETTEIGAVTSMDLSSVVVSRRLTLPMENSAHHSS